MSDEWRDISGWGDLYEVSRSGSVRNKRTGRVSRIHRNDVGYCKVSLNRGDGVFKEVALHRAVAIAFVENPRGAREVNHKDLDKTNNNASNLEWATRSENMRHAGQMGALCKSGRRRGVPLSAEASAEIRKRYATGKESKSALARAYGVCPRTIARAIGR